MSLFKKLEKINLIMWNSISAIKSLSKSPWPSLLFRKNKKLSISFFASFTHRHSLCSVVEEEVKPYIFLTMKFRIETSKQAISASQVTLQLQTAVFILGFLHHEYIQQNEGSGGSYTLERSWGVLFSCRDTSMESFCWATVLGIIWEDRKTGENRQFLS